MKIITVAALLPEMIRATLCHVLILDDMLGKYSAAEWIRNLKTEFPALKIMVLTANTDPLYIQLLEKSGVNGIVHNSTEGSEVKTGLFKIMEGLIYFCPIIAGALARKRIMATEVAEDGNHLKLCPRQKETLQCMLNRMTIKEMTVVFGVNEQCIKNYRSNVLIKVKGAGYKNVKDYGKKTGLIN